MTNVCHPPASSVSVASITVLRNCACSSVSFPPWFGPRGRSFSIAPGPSRATRFRQRPTLFSSTASSAAIALFVLPSAAISTILALSRNRTDVLRADAHPANLLRSPFVNSTAAATRIAYPSAHRSRLSLAVPAKPAREIRLADTTASDLLHRPDCVQRVELKALAVVGEEQPRRNPSRPFVAVDESVVVG